MPTRQAVPSAREEESSQVELPASRSTPTAKGAAKGKVLRPDDPTEQAWDVIVIGAGPTGMACGIDLQKIGMRALLIDKGCLVNSIFNYPVHMTFFTTPELLEIGHIPFTTAHQKPTREEALEYYRNVAQRYELPIRQYERVMAVTGHDNAFVVLTQDRLGNAREYRCKKLIVAIGYYDLPNLLGIPGEDLPKVSHYYSEPHPYYRTDVLVIGAKNSAAEAALDLWRHGARVTLVHRGPEMHGNIKYWVKPDIDNRIRNREIQAHFDTRVLEIRPDSVLLENGRRELEIHNDFVFALTGYHPDFDFLRGLGIELVSAHNRPLCDPETLESNVPGIYVAGVILAGSRTNEIFIENGRFHGGLIANHLRHKFPDRRARHRRRSSNPTPDAT